VRPNKFELDRVNLSDQTDSEKSETLSKAENINFSTVETKTNKLYIRLRFAVPRKFGNLRLKYCQRNERILCVKYMCQNSRKASFRVGK
jgi:hypothetical protein